MKTQLLVAESARYFEDERPHCYYYQAYSLSPEDHEMTTQPMPDVPPGFDELSKEEQIEYVQALWNRIAADETDVPIPDWHLQIVRERLGTFDPEESVSWPSVRDRLKRRNDG